jgi:hypothetical protein
VLDHTLMVWTQESGPITHGSSSIPVITFGSAGGYFTTGSQIDYRMTTPFSGGGMEYPGLFYQQWLGMNLKAFGIPTSEWAEPDHGGYGYRFSNVQFQSLNTQQAYPDAMWALNGDPLPFLKA